MSEQRLVTLHGGPLDEQRIPFEGEQYRLPVDWDGVPLLAWQTTDGFNESDCYVAQPNPDSRDAVWVENPTVRKRVSRRIGEIEPREGGIFGAPPPSRPWWKFWR